MTGVQTCALPISPPSFGAPRPVGPAPTAPRGPVPSLDPRLTATAYQMPAPPAFAAPPPLPRPSVAPPPPISPPPSPAFEQQSLGAPAELSERPPAEHLTVRDDRDPSKKQKGKRKPGGSGSPFDRANEVLERLRRDKGGPL